MQPDPEHPSLNASPQAGSVPPLLPTSEPPVIGASARLAGASLPQEANGKSSPMRKVFAILLSLCLGLFLADAIVSLVDESLILFLNIHVLGAIRGLLFLFAMLLGIVIYFLMGLAPMIPKRLFSSGHTVQPGSGACRNSILDLFLWSNSRAGPGRHSVPGSPRPEHPPLRPGWN